VVGDTGVDPIQAAPFVSGEMLDADGIDAYPPRPVPRIPWPTYFRHLSEVFEPGYHISILAPTRRGKTHLILRGLTPLWADPVPAKSTHILFVDMKDHDEILEGWGRLVSQLPPSWQRHPAIRGWVEDDSKPPWYRIRIPSKLSGASPTVQAERVRTALMRAWQERNWVVILDEMRPLLELGLKEEIVDLLERGGSNHVSGVFGTQAPQYMPSQLFDQPMHVFLGGVGDARTRDRYREIGGRTSDMLAALLSLQEYEWVAVSEDGQRLEIVKAPE
jgi:hypothetical protein